MPGARGKRTTYSKARRTTRRRQGKRSGKAQAQGDERKLGVLGAREMVVSKCVSAISWLQGMSRNAMRQMGVWRAGAKLLGCSGYGNAMHAGKAGWSAARNAMLLAPGKGQIIRCNGCWKGYSLKGLALACLPGCLALWAAVWLAGKCWQALSGWLAGRGMAANWQQKKKKSWHSWGIRKNASKLARGKAVGWLQAASNDKASLTASMGQGLTNGRATGSK